MGTERCIRAALRHGLDRSTFALRGGRSTTLGDGFLIRRSPLYVLFFLCCRIDTETGTRSIYHCLVCRLSGTATCSMSSHEPVHSGSCQWRTLKPLVSLQRVACADDYNGSSSVPSNSLRDVTKHAESDPAGGRSRGGHSELHAIKPHTRLEAASKEPRTTDAACRHREAHELNQLVSGQWRNSRTDLHTRVLSTRMGCSRGHWTGEEAVHQWQCAYLNCSIDHSREASQFWHSTRCETPTVNEGRPAPDCFRLSSFAHQFMHEIYQITMWLRCTTTDLFKDVINLVKLAYQTVKIFGCLTAARLNTLDQYTRQQQAHAPTNASATPLTLIAQLLGRALGWWPWTTSVFQAALAPNSPATSQPRNDDSLSTTAAFQPLTTRLLGRVLTQKLFSYIKCHHPEAGYDDVHINVDRRPPSPELIREDTPLRCEALVSALRKSWALASRTITVESQSVAFDAIIIESQQPSEAGNTFDSAELQRRKKRRPTSSPQRLKKRIASWQLEIPGIQIEAHVRVPPFFTAGSPTQQEKPTARAVTGNMETMADMKEYENANNRTWNPSHGIAFVTTKRMSAPASPVPDHDGSARAISDSASESEASESVESDNLDDTYTALDYQIPEATMAEALEAPYESPSSYWSYDKYKSSKGDSVVLHYCKSREASEKVAQLFLNQPVVGCDIEWKPLSKVGKVTDIKSNVSVIQLACQDRVGIFQLALHKGETAEELLAPTLKHILGSPDIIKCGVSIGSDFTRMENFLGIERCATFELSHLHRLVQYGVTSRHLVNKKLVGLAEQTKAHLGLPLYKGDERTSDWSQPLSMEQCKYAADDAYASYRVFEALKEKWYALDPRPPFPAWAELGLPIRLAPLPRNESSESETESSSADFGSDDEVDLLRSRIKRSLERDREFDQASGSSFGSNAFDGLTQDELSALEEADYPHSGDTRTAPSYPTLVSKLNIEESKQFSPGRLGLQHRLRIASSRSDRDMQPSQHSMSTSLDSEQESEFDGDSETSCTNLSRISEKNKDLVLEATNWANHTRSSSLLAIRPSLTTSSLRAYYLWEHKGLEIPDIAAILREKPLKTATVAAYVAECIQSGNMEYHDLKRLRALVKLLPRQALGNYWRLRKLAREG